MAALTALEWQTCIVEDFIGRYLNARNNARPAEGRTWEMRQSVDAASEQLEETARQSGRLNDEAALVGDFKALLELLPDDVGVQLSPEKFLQLYRTLPQPLRGRMVTADLLASASLTSNWQRTAVWRRGEGAVAYLIDDRSRVISSVNIDADLLLAAELYGARTATPLSDNPRFKGNIYSGRTFFEALFALPETERLAIFLSPDVLINLPRNATRAGMGTLSDSAGLSLLGFESGGAGGVAVLTYPVNRDALSALIRMLREPEAGAAATTSSPATQ